ncbi:MAG: ABC transporter ATP-binding protein [Micromonosporaceae bacterium]
MTSTQPPPSRVGPAALLPYLRGQAAPLVAAAVLSLVAAAGTLAQPLLVRLVLDDLAAGRPVGRYVLLVVAVLVGIAGVNGVISYLLQRGAEGLVLTTRRRLAGHLLRLPIAEYDRRRTGDLLARVGADTTLLRTVVTSGLLELASGALVVVGAVVMMVALDPLMFAVTVAGLLGMLGAVAIARRVRTASQHAQAKVGEMTSAVERAISAVRTIRAARAEAREAALVSGAAREAYAAGLRMARLTSLVGPTVATTVQAAFLAVLGVGGARVAAGAMSLGDLVAFVLFLFILMMPLAQAMAAYTQLQAALGALQRIEDVLRLPTEDAADAARAATAGSRPDASAAPVPRTPATAATGSTRPPAAGTRPPAVEFDRVRFAYPGGEPVLHGVSFRVEYGTRTAVVGPSGAGKSTLLALVERFYDVDEGAVRVGGVDVRDQPRDVLRAQLGYVEQEAPVLAGTIRDNLLLARPDATEEELRRVLAAVNLTELATRAPEGLDAQVGEGGVLLSGGERQRLAIARTLLAAPPILLLDEPTSNLDSRNEQALRAAIDAAAADRTTIVVAHRLATVVDADQIVVLDRGRVVATGRHEELAATDPLYRELAAHQLLVP